VFEQLKENPPKKDSPLDLPSLTDEQKLDLVVAWKLRGVSITVLAKTFGVSRRTIYNWLAKAKGDYISNMEEQTYLELIAENDLSLEHLESIALAELDRITSPEYGMGKEGQVHVKTSKASVRELSELLRTVASIRDQRMKLHTTVGLIPRVPDKIHTKISHKLEDSTEEYQMTADDLRLTMIEKLNRISRL